MINFFRKISKQLADDNKPLKYLRYAIGEILLVVIGILIALQINAWNEKVEGFLLDDFHNGFIPLGAGLIDDVLKKCESIGK